MNTDKVIIIAEAGVNHNGQIKKAIELIDVAAKAEVDFVKFQTFTADKIVHKSVRKTKYQSDNIGDDNISQYDMLKSLELSEDDHHILIQECKKRGIQFLSTAFDVEGVDFLDQLGLPLFKSPSGEITNYPFLKRLAEKGKPIILSTGMATIQEVKDAIGVLLKYGLNKSLITVLHCNTEYPTPMSDVNLKAMNTISDELGVKVGYSDHTLGIEVSIAAVAMGAKVIEKHFTLDRHLPGPDHRASLEPNELIHMVSSIRNIEIALSGSGKKEPSISELKNLSVVRKSLHTTRKLRKGHIISENDLIPLRPSTGISPMKIDDVLGRKLKTDINAFEILNWSDLI